LVSESTVQPVEKILNIGFEVFLGGRVRISVSIQ